MELLSQTFANILQHPGAHTWGQIEMAAQEEADSALASLQVRHGEQLWRIVAVIWTPCIRVEMYYTEHHGATLVLNIVEHSGL